MTAQGPLGIMWEKRMTEGSVNRHKKEPELKCPSKGVSCALGGGSGPHGLIYNRVVEEG